MFKLRPHTTFYNNFFLWRTDIRVNGHNIQVGLNKDEEIVLQISEPQLEIPFNWLVQCVRKILQSHQLPEVTRYWYEKAPLFLLEVTCSEDLTKLFTQEDVIQEEVAMELRRKMESLRTSKSTPATTDSLHVSVQTDVYHMTLGNDVKKAKVFCVRNSSHNLFIKHFSESAIFDVGAVFNANHDSPTQEDNGNNRFTMNAHSLT